MTNFAEKDLANEGYINGGYFVFNKKLDEYILDPMEPLEQGPLKNLAKTNNLTAYKHQGYWRPVDTIRELEILESDITEGKIKFG